MGMNRNLSQSAEREPQHGGWRHYFGEFIPRMDGSVAKRLGLEAA